MKTKKNDNTMTGKILFEKMNPNQLLNIKGGNENAGDGAPTAVDKEID